MKAVIYCRVSTDTQETEGTSLHTQLDACLDRCQSKGCEVDCRFSGLPRLSLKPSSGGTC